ncbi:SDR family oxidoreductase [Prescottella agglutinans]|uniref:NADP-dependent 3-hydroxy acid dehydrogenase YdfG n=1 Tax=Prescottella agglutinans TaxID=1644129 RepID=A0ABT6M514_9NOCA|nr:SDR family oxidoreductase [Prescottella agglutinans]MDH6279401.1 NADP-dependent 3-hydroxy acid dehydrogenase YdfG [Prescottella agglutinans]
MTRYPEIALPGARVLVTGAGRGIGRATALAFAARGASVALADIDRVAVENAATGVGTAHVLDVRSRASWDACVAEVGPIDILVNNAGVMPVGGFLAESDATAEMTLDVNVWGPIHGMRAVVPGMIERVRGHVVNVASLAGKIAIPGLAVYNASKYAAVGLSAATRLEFADHGVSVSTVLPSAVRTTLTSGIPLGKGLPTVDPEDIAAAVVRTVRTRRAETPVPGYLAALDLGLAVAPEPLMRLIRRVVGGQRALTSVDPTARADYDARLRRAEGA